MVNNSYCRRVWYQICLETKEKLTELYWQTMTGTGQIVDVAVSLLSLLIEEERIPDDLGYFLGSKDPDLLDKIQKLIENKRKHNRLQFHVE